jgi:methyl-accepting chemotaxis protein
MFQTETNLKQRIVFIALIGTLPLALISLWLLHNSINKSINFGEQELRGDAFQRPLEKLLDLTPRYEAAARKALAGDPSAKAEMADLQHQMDSQMETLSADYNGELGRALKFTDTELAARKREDARLSVVLAEWQGLKAAPLTVAAGDDSAGKLTAAIRMMIAHAGDLSNLILDTDLDSYYLVDATLSTLPQTQQRLSDITLQAGSWLRNGQAVSNRTQLAVMAAMLQQDDEDRITGDAQTSLTEDKNFYGISASLQTNLPPAIAKYTAANQAFLGLLNRVVAGENVPAADFENAGWQARAESFRLWDTGAAELDRLLDIRLSVFRRQQWMNIGIILAALAFVSLVICFNLRTLNARFANLVTTLTENSNTCASAAGHVSEASQSLAAGASEQAASLEETGAAIEELSSMTKRNAENAQKANALAQQTRHAADKGVADTQSMNTAMNDIKASSDDIAKIIKTIDEIAFQTNILALNAAVEAARAGESGMGFAVVADEVRNLAQRSAQAAKETAAKIEGAIAKTALAVHMSGTVAETLNDIVTKVRQVDELVAEVSSATREQNQGITEINTSVGQMDKVTQSTAASAEESAASAEELNAQAMVMKEAVGDLLRLVGGDRTAAERSPAGNAPASRKKPDSSAPFFKTKAAKILNGNGQRRATGNSVEIAPRHRASRDGDFENF